MDNKTENRPSWLYKFQRMNDDNLSALEERKIWFSSVDKFNDPFEFMFLTTSTVETETAIGKFNVACCDGWE